MPYRIAGIDVHKKMLAVVVSDVESRLKTIQATGYLKDDPSTPKARLSD